MHLTSNLDKWVGKQRVQRSLLGSGDERSVRAVAGRETLAGFPDGIYGVLVAGSRFEKKHKGVAVITLGKDPYGSWKVVSYVLR